MIKDVVVNKIMTCINNHCDYDEIKIAEIRYGIEALYLSLTKTIGILLIAWILGILLEILILLLFYHLLRATGFGVHATKSWHCWLGSSIIFLGVPILIKYVTLPLWLMMIVSLICCLLILVYAPADTEKRPLINKKRRQIFKTCCTITSLLYVILIVVIPNTFLQLTIMYALIIETFMILPLSYKIFGAKYNNYKTYFSNS